MRKLARLKKLPMNIFNHFISILKKTLKKNNLPWRLQSQYSGGGLFLDVGCHALDILDYYFGALLEVKGYAKNIKSLYEVEDFVHMTFKTSNDALGSATWNFSSFLTKDILTISGSKGKIELSIFGNEPIRLKKNKFFSKSIFFPIKNNPPIQKPMIESIVNQLLGKGTCPGSAESAARTSKVMDLVLKNYYGNREENFWENPKNWPGKNE